MNQKMISLGLFSVLCASGCATTHRAVTHVRVEKDKAYVAYAEWDEGAFSKNERSRVKRCSINQDNSMACEEDADINRVLNPQEAGGEPAPAEPAPASEPAPAAAPAADAPPADAPAGQS